MKITERSTIGAHWQDSVIHHSTSCAVADAVCSYTYEEAEARIGRIRAFIKKQGISSGKVIAVETFNRADFWITVLGIVTCGCAYLPLPPQYPEERKKFMYDDSKAVYRLTREEIERICSDESAPYSNAISDSPDSPCYVIYTSGTTGKPKGVVIRQRWLMNLCKWNIGVTELKADSRVLSLNALCFDASVKNIFSPMIVGAELLMNIEHPMDIRSLYAYISEHEPTHINATPGILELLIEEAAEKGYTGMKSLCCIMSGGEAFRKKQLCRLYEIMGDKLRILNVYGPTECTSVTTCHVLTDEELSDHARPVPIGRPICGKKVLTVRDDGNRCSPGEQGELFIGGTGTAEGYIGDPEKTAEKFVTYENEIYYRSGDLCSIDNDGVVHYFGRIDTQVKLNGYRIETEEIATKASVVEGISSAAVLFENEKLVLFYKADKQIETEEIRDTLAKTLPEYMIPSEYVMLSSIPVTERGKTDLCKLRKIYDERSAAERGEKHYDGEQDMTLQIIGVWEKLLGRNDIRSNDNFFDVGGNSLKLYKMGKLLERKFEVPIDPMDLMELSSVQKIAGYISEQKGMVK